MDRRFDIPSALKLLLLIHTASQYFAQSVYTPYTFSTLTGNADFTGSADGTRVATGAICAGQGRDRPTPAGSSGETPSMIDKGAPFVLLAP